MKDTPLVDTDALRTAYRPGGDIMGAWAYRVRERRLSLRLSIDQLAGLANTTRQTIGRIEAGTQKPRDYLRVALARALACEVDDLFPNPTFDEIRDRYAFDEVAS